jgi:competence protein ComEA
VLEQSRAQLAGYAVAAVLVMILAAKLLGAGGGPDAQPQVRLDRSAAPGGAPGRGAPQVYVHVAGEVRRPGLYRLPPSARLAAALERAGGPTSKADLASVNLAATVKDGQQVVVARAGVRTGSPAAAGSGSGVGVGAKVSLATATPEQLDALDGIGPTLAKRIVDYREAHGGFRSVDELREVEGIGEKRLAALREALNP